MLVMLAPTVSREPPEPPETLEHPELLDRTAPLDRTVPRVPLALLESMEATEPLVTRA